MDACYHLLICKIEFFKAPGIMGFLFISRVYRNTGHIHL